MSETPSRRVSQGRIRPSDPICERKADENDAKCSDSAPPPEFNRAASTSVLMRSSHGRLGARRHSVDNLSTAKCTQKREPRALSSPANAKPEKQEARAKSPTKTRETKSPSKIREKSPSKQREAVSPSKSGGSSGSTAAVTDSDEQETSDGAEKERSRSVVSNRLDRLSKPKPLPEQQPIVPEMPPKKVMPTRSIRPSTLIRVSPQNVDECMEAFFEDPSVAPIFKYLGSPEAVNKAFMSKSLVDFSLVDVAKNVLNLVMTEHDGSEAYMTKTYSGDRITCDELVSRVRDYLEDLNLLDKVEIRTWPNMLSAANVVKPAPEGKYIVNLTQNPVTEVMVESICDHEIGTHLLRMLNNEHQVWSGCRDRYNLIDPWVTEEGFATINTYRSMKGQKIMFPQALKYFAICRGAELGFCELYAELEPFMPDPKRRFRMCCRVKRGMVNTAEPGAFNVDQAYFRGAVELLRKIETIDFGRLYCGQVAHEDMDKVHNLIRKEVLRLPRFLNSAERLKKYMKHCRQMIDHNMLEMDEPKGKSVFVRAAKQFFKTEKERQGKIITLECEKRMSTTLPVLNSDRLNDLSKPKALTLPEEVVANGPRRSLDPEWLAAMSKPQRPQETQPQTEKKTVPLASLQERLDFLSMPKAPTIEDETPVASKRATKSVPRSTSKKPAAAPRTSARSRSPVVARRSKVQSIERTNTASTSASESSSRVSSKQQPARQELRMGVCEFML